MVDKELEQAKAWRKAQREEKLKWEYRIAQEEEGILPDPEEISIPLPNNGGVLLRKA